MDDSPAERPCELCELAPVTPWHGEFDGPVRFRVVDCDSCEVPMAVIVEHRNWVTEAEKEGIRRELGKIADRRYPSGWVFDDNMRQIPDHYHAHARPIPSWAARLRSS